MSPLRTHSEANCWQPNMPPQTGEDIHLSVVGQFPTIRRNPRRTKLLLLFVSRVLPGKTVFARIVACK